MIAETNAIELLEKNLQRTEMLIAAMEKVKAFNQIYQTKQTDLEYYRMVKTIQDKELAQQLLAQYPNHFVSRHTTFSGKVTDLIDSDELLIYEDIERRLELKDRFGYYEFFVAYSIPFLSREEETLVEYLYLRRNNYVHNAGRPDKKSMGKLVKTPSPFKEKTTSTEAKRLRTKLKKTLVKSYDRVIATVKQF
jgi:hypothetical protein